MNVLNRPWLPGEERLQQQSAQVFLVDIPPTQWRGDVLLSQRRRGVLKCEGCLIFFFSLKLCGYLFYYSVNISLFLKFSNFLSLHLSLDHS